MYTQIYFYLIDKENLHKFIELKQLVAEIMIGYGALEDEIYHCSTSVKSATTNRLIDLFKVEDTEKILFGQLVFRNKSHCEEVMDKVLKNEELNEFNQNIEKLINPIKLFSASFFSD